MHRITSNIFRGPQSSPAQRTTQILFVFGNLMLPRKIGPLWVWEDNLLINPFAIFPIIIYLRKCLHSDWQRAWQLIPNSGTWNFLSAEIRVKSLKNEKQDWRVPWKTMTKKNKMVHRFAESNNILIQSLKDNAKDKNTQQSTNNWITVCINRILVGGVC